MITEELENQELIEIALECCDCENIYEAMECGFASFDGWLYIGDGLSVNGLTGETDDDGR